MAFSEASRNRAPTCEMILESSRYFCPEVSRNPVIDEPRPIPTAVDEAFESQFIAICPPRASIPGCSIGEAGRPGAEVLGADGAVGAGGADAPGELGGGAVGAGPGAAPGAPGGGGGDGGEGRGAPEPPE